MSNHDDYIPVRHKNNLATSSVPMNSMDQILQQLSGAHETLERIENQVVSLYRVFGIELPPNKAISNDAVANNSIRDRVKFLIIRLSSIEQLTSNLVPTNSQ